MVSVRFSFQQLPPWFYNDCTEAAFYDTKLHDNLKKWISALMATMDVLVPLLQKIDPEDALAAMKTEGKGSVKFTTNQTRGQTIIAGDSEVVRAPSLTSKMQSLFFHDHDWKDRLQRTVFLPKQ